MWCALLFCCVDDSVGLDSTDAMTAADDETRDVGEVDDAGGAPDAETVTDATTEPGARRPVGRSLALGNTHSCGVLPDGRVECWGNNTYGQLGVGDSEPRLGRVVVEGLDQVLEVTAGVGHTCARRTDGSVYCWGRNDDGACGNGSTIGSKVPRPVAGLADIDHIRAGSWHTCALDGDRRAWCWGSNGSGELGDGTTERRLAPVRVLGLPDDVVALATGLYLTCALLEGGTVACWGRLFPEELGPLPMDVEDLVGVRTIEAGYGHVCAGRDNGRVSCWGDNTNGALGDGTRTHRTAPTPVIDVASVEELAAAQFSCARHDNGTVSCWGAWFGPLSFRPQTVPGIADTAEIAHGGHHVCVRLRAGGVRCFGSNSSGQAGGCCVGYICGLPEGAACGEGAANTGICTDGWCSGCGAEDEPCCSIARPGGARCRNDRLICAANDRCERCGGVGQRCCGTACRDVGAVCFDGQCRVPGTTGAPCLAGNACVQGCCVLRGHSDMVCIDIGEVCPGQTVGGCTPEGSCGACGGVGETCCPATESTRIPSYCSAPDTSCEEDICRRP